MGEYRRKADRMDALLADGGGGGGGRVRRQLDLFGDLITVVVGKWQVQRAVRGWAHAAGRDGEQQGSHGGEEDRDGQSRGKDGEGSNSGGAPTTALGGEPPRLHGLLA